MVTGPVEQASESGKMNTNAQPNKKGQPQRSCVDCHTTMTPLWRGGPAGPKSLCNACGIRHRKQRSALLGLDKGGGKKTKNKKRSNGSSRLVAVNLRLMALGSDVTFQTRPESKTQWRRLGEVERAATLLMSLSSASLEAYLQPSHNNRKKKEKKNGSCQKLNKIPF